MAVIHLQVHERSPAGGDCDAHDRLVDGRPIRHRQEVLVEDRGRVRAAAPPQRSEESAAGGMDLCLNKALLVLRDDPVPLPVQPDDDPRRAAQDSLASC